MEHSPIYLLKTTLFLTRSLLRHKPVDHVGVPNTQLVLEKHPLAAHYNGKSVAEQNSIDLSWELLMDETFQDLRRAISANEAEFKRFR